MIAERCRPRKFVEVKGQVDEVELLKKVVEKEWKPPAMLFEGPFGTGKTTLVRLLARAILCSKRDGVEPCGVCNDCVEIHERRHPAYMEIDAASNGLVADARQIKDMLQYQVMGYRNRVLCIDECHMLTVPAQNALLKMLEEGIQGTIVCLVTTEPKKLLPTIRSRCVEVNLKILTVLEVFDRLVEVVDLEGMKAEERALRIIATYSRGHLRDALVLLEQISKMGEIKGDEVRRFLKLDRRVEIYKLLLMQSRKEIVEGLEKLLCEIAPKELMLILGEVLLDAYKISIGMDHVDVVDREWLKKINATSRGDMVVKAADVLKEMESGEVSTVQHGVAVILKTVFGGGKENVVEKKSETVMVGHLRKIK